MGRAAFLLMNTGERLVLRISAAHYDCLQIWRRSRALRLEGGVAISGALCNGFATISGSFKKSSERGGACNAPSTTNGGVYFVPAFFRSLRSLLEGECAGSIVGLTRYANKGHIHGGLEARISERESWAMERIQIGLESLRV